MKSQKTTRLRRILSVGLGIMFLSMSLATMATDLHVETNGNDISGNGTSGAPFATIRKAAELAGNGDRILIGAGTFTENDGRITIRDGVDMIGAGIDVTIIQSNYNGNGNPLKNTLFQAFDGVDCYAVQSNGVNGNEFAHFTIDGMNNQLANGIDVRNRNNIHIHDIKIINTSYAALFVATDEQNWDPVETGPTSFYPQWWNTNVEIHDVIVIDGGSRLPSNFTTEAVKLGNIDGLRLYNNHFEAQAQGGVLICSWNEGWNKDVEIYNNTFIQTIPSGYPGNPQWGNYNNIEFKNPIGYHHVYDNVNQNVWWSFVSGLDYWGDAIYNPETDPNNPKGLVLDIHDNEVYFDETTDFILGLENGWGYSEAYDNYFFLDPTNPNVGTHYGVSVTMRDLNHSYVYRNYIDGFTSGVLVSAENREDRVRKDTRIFNNTIVNSVSYGLRITAKKPMEGIYIQNNIFYGMDGKWGPHAMAFIEGLSSASLSDIQIQNNNYFLGDGTILNYQNATAESRVSNLVIENNVSADPLLNLSGDRPIPYYHLSSQSSSAIDIGVDLGYSFAGAAPDAGAHEFGQGSNGVDVSAVDIVQANPEVFEGFNIQLTASVAPLDAENQFVSWSSADNGIATVNANGAVTGVSVGTVDITATSVSNPGVSDVVTLTVMDYVNCTAAGEIEMERWDDIAGSSIGSLKNSPNYPDNPSSISTLYKLEFADVDKNYGIRMRGYICAPTTGDYTFWINGDDHVQFWISDDFEPGKRKLVASHTDWTNWDEWDKYASQKSELIPLIAGRSYYIEVFMKENDGGDFVRVGWTKPGDSASATAPAEIIPGSVLSPFETVSVSSVTINEASQTLLTGNDLQLTATVLPADASNLNVTWSSSDDAVASVNSNGMVTGNAAGSADITVRTVNGALTSTVTITIEDAPVIAATGVSIDQANQSIDDGTSLVLTANISPEGASNQTVTWASADLSVASVNADGVVEALSPGSTDITATTADGGFTSSVTITVNAVGVTGVSISPGSKTILENETVQLNANTTPSNATNQGVNWSSSNTNVATVDNTGLVTGLSIGSVTITATTNDGSHVATSNVTVNESIVGTGNHYYVETPINGGDDTNSGTASSPFATIRKAALSATSVGDVIHIGAGTFTEHDGEITIHDGVSMFGAGIDVTIIESNYNPSGNYMRNVLFKLFEGVDAWNITGQGANGNEFAHFTINGFEQLGVAIDVRERDNIHFHDFKVMNCYYSAIHVATDENNWGASSSQYYPYWWNKNLRMHDLHIINGGGQVQYDRLYGSEAIKIGNIDGGELWNLRIDENMGGALICSWNEGWNRNLSIHDNEFVLTESFGYPGHPEWGNYLNIEFKNPIGIHEIYNNYNENTWWSFVSGLDYWGDAIYDPDTESGLVLDMHDNEVYLDEEADYILACELGWGYSELYNNYFHRDETNPNDGTVYGISITMKDLNRNLVHHNVIDNFTSGFLISAKNDAGNTRRNIYVTNNTVRNSKTHAIKFSGVIKPLSDVFIQNNIFDGTNGHAMVEIRANSWQPISNVHITNNIHYNGNGEILDIQDGAESRISNFTVENNLEADPQLIKAGDTPYPFYELSSLNSPAVDFGIPIVYENFDMGMSTMLGAAPDAGAKDIGASDPDIPITSLIIDQGANTSLSFGTQTTLTATVSPSNASYSDVYWSSDNEAIATVDRFTGVVTAVAEGQVNISAKTLEETFIDAIAVNVTYVHVDNISINEGNQTIDENTYQQLSLTITPANADNTNVTWVSSDESVVSVDETGNVYGVGPGNATVTVTAEDGGLTDQVSFSINDVFVPVASVSIDNAETEVFIGRTIDLTETVLPVNADNKAVTWSTNNSGIATVDQSGIVTGIADGNVTITVTSDENGAISSNLPLSVAPVPPNDLPWTEDFTGLADGTEIDTGNTAWSISGNASNHLMVVGERLEGLRTYNTGVTMVTEPIDISFTPASISIDISERGSMEYQDYVRVYYSVDGGADVLVGEITDDLPGGEDDANESDIVNISLDNIDGNSLVVKVEVYCSGGDEYWFVDNLSVFETGSNSGSGDPIAVTGVAMDVTTQALSIGGNVQLNATISPTNATDQTITWTSSDTGVVTVDASGVITGVAFGNATITATTNDGGFTAVSSVTVSDTQNVSTIYETEDRSNGNNVWTKSTFSGYTGTGYADYSGSPGGWLEWDNIDGGVGGNTTLTVRYTNGNSNDQTADISVNGTVVTTITFGNSGGWHLWGTAEANVDLSTGNNTIRITATSSNGGPNMDHMEATVQSAGGSDPVIVTGVSIDQSSTSVNEGATTQLSATIAPATATNQSVTWSTSDANIASVDANGLVTALADGTATITVTSADGGFTDDLIVTVNEVSVSVTGISIDQSAVSIDEGTTTQLSPTIAPADATNQSVTWSTSDANIASVDANGLVTAVSDGTATITVTSAEGGFTDDLTVTVNEVIVAVTGVSLNQSSVSLASGNTSQLIAAITPANATNQTVSWISSNSAVATVDTNGLVSGVSQGSATITVSTQDGSYTAAAAVSVSNAGNVTTVYEAEDRTNSSNVWTKSTYSGYTGTGYADYSGSAGGWLEWNNVDGGVGGNTTLVVRYTNGNSNDKTADIAVNGTVVETIIFANTGGWHLWGTSEVSVDLLAGANTVRITATSSNGGPNMDHMEATVQSAGGSNPVALTGISIDQSSTTIDEGATAQLTASLSPTNATNQVVTWSTSDASVATVDSNGLVSGISTGSATITVTTTDGGFTDNVSVTVNAVSIPVTSVAIDQSSATVDEGATTQLTASLSPVDATNQSVTWSTSDASVATVDSNGLVSGISTGSATITVTTTDGGLTDNVSVTVNAVSIPVTSVAIDQSSATVDEGATTQLTASLSPVDATNQVVTWSTSDASVATVDSNGLVSGISTGSATVTVTTTDGGLTDNINVSVNSTTPSNNDLPWVEDFTGLTDGTESDNGTTAWSIQGNASNYLEIRNEKLEGNKIYSSGVKLVSQNIDISGVTNVNISVDVTKWGWMEYQDYVRLYYVVDGGSPVFADEVLGDYSASGDYIANVVTLAASGISGNTLQLQIEIRNDWTNETWYIDDIHVSYESNFRLSSASSIADDLKEEKEVSFSLYPNPVSDGMLNIEHKREGETFIRIVDVAGNTAYFTEMTNDSHKLDLKELSSGVYFLLLNDNESTIHRRFIIK